MNSHLGQACDAKVSALIEKKKKEVLIPGKGNLG